MSREEKVDWLLQVIEFIEGAILHPIHFDDFTDEELDKEIEWYEYLLEK